MTVLRLRIWIQPEAQGGYIATCPELPGAMARGGTWIETLTEMDQSLQSTFASHLEEAISAACVQIEEPPEPQPMILELAFATPGDDATGSYATVA